MEAQLEKMHPASLPASQHTHTYTHIHACTCAHARTHTHTHTHIHTLFIISSQTEMHSHIALGSSTMEHPRRTFHSAGDYSLT